MPPHKSINISVSTQQPYWLFVDLAANFGGHEVMLLRWIEELVKQQTIKPILICMSGSRLAQLAKPICTVVELKVPSVSVRKLDAALLLLRVLTTMAAIVWQRRPQAVVVAEGCLMAQRHGLKAAALLRQNAVLYVPLVATFAEMGFPDAERLEHRMKISYGKLPTSWLTITPDQAREFRKWSQVKQPIYCLPNTVSASIEALQGKRLKRETPTSTVRTKILVLGRLDEIHKGLDFLLEHLTLNPKIGENFEINIVGDGPFGAHLNQAILDNHFLATCLKISPWGDAIELMNSHDVLLLPSRFEGVPLVMLEAMALGLPVVASDMPGTRTYLSEECLFKIGDLSSAFEKLHNLRQQPHLWQQVAQNNIQTFREKASGNAFSLATAELSISILKNNLFKEIFQRN